MNVRMSEPRTVRLNEKSNPTRSADFDADCGHFSCDPNEVIRNLVDAWRLYTAEHGHPPRFPVVLRPVPGAKGRAGPK